MINSCDSTRVYDEYKQVTRSEWHKDSLVVFEVPVNDTVLNYNLFLNIRNEVNYPYSNLWLFVEIVQPDGMAVKDTFELILADPSGKWLGKGLSGIRSRRAIYRRNVFFPLSGNYLIKIRHGMRPEMLKGIHDVGVRIERASMD
ncbi:MAG: gliding motility lipoprotein GldH [Bacteroidales bacterium]|jgi:gliding motility-associated lipoprotein GldH|nr:gliding motility lipoprotein GldH [Bacteroidales bacterium]